MSEAESSRSTPGWKIGSLRGVPVYLGRTWPIIAVVIVALFGPQLHDDRPDLGAMAYVVAALYAVLLLISVLIHEASHALMGQARGYKVNRIVADLWGGHTAYDTADTTPGSTALVAVVGPLSNGVLALLAYLSLPIVPDGVPTALVSVLAWSNAFVAAFNMLPGLPLDGGYLVDAAVWKATGSRAQGMIVAGWCGRVVTVLVLLWALVVPLLSGRSPSLVTVVWALFLGTFLWAGASAAIKGGTVRRVVTRVVLRQVAQPVTIVADDTRLDAVLPLPAHAVAVHGSGRGLWGLLDAEAVAAIPEQSRANAPASAVARAQPAGWVVQVASLDGDVLDVLGAMQETGADRVLVLTQEEPPVAAIVAADVLVAALGQAEHGRA